MTDHGRGGYVAYGAWDFNSRHSIEVTFRRIDTTRLDASVVTIMQLRTTTRLCWRAINFQTGREIAQICFTRD